MEDNKNSNKVRFKLKIEKVKKSGIHLNKHLLYAKVALHVKAIRLHERYIPMRCIMHLTPKHISHSLSIQICIVRKVAYQLVPSHDQ